MIQNLYAVEDVKAVAHWITERKGGRGAVREIVDALLKAKNLYEQAAGLYNR